MKRILFLFLIFTFCNQTLLSQAWLEPFNDREDVTFEEIQNYAQEYFKNFDITKRGNAWKPYKRWEYFWQDRLMPDGTFPSSKLILEARREFNSNSKNNTVQSNHEWQILGPFDSPGGYSGMGRVNCVSRNPSNGELFVGTASGGIWKSTNNGNTWTTNTDKLDIMQSLGVTDITFHPTNSDIIYIATGDGFGGNTYSLGILKSTNGGDNWETTGLTWEVNQFRRICRVLIDPENPEILYTAGSYGIHKSTDGGDNWDRIHTGNYKDLEFKPGSSSTLYATGNTFWKTTDNGTSWNQISNGIPTSNVRRIAIAVTKDADSVVYALVGNTQNTLTGVYLSTNSGESFSEIADSDPNMMGYEKDGSGDKGQVGYDLCIEANPTDWKEAWIGGINIWKTEDAGSNWSICSMWYGNWNDVTTIHADQHDLWYDDSIDRLYLGNDGGIYSTDDGGNSWDWKGSGILATQFYKIAVSHQDSTVYIGGTQDNGTKVHQANGNWRDVIGGDGMECIINFDDDDIMYGSLYYGDIRKSTNGGTNFKKINDSDNDGEYDDIDEEGRWVTPYLLNPQNSNSLYVGMINVWKSTDEGETFNKISTFSGNKLSNLKIAPSDTNYIYASTNNTLYRTTNNGNSWDQISRPGNSNISDIHIDYDDPNKLWATNSGYSANNKVFESTDGGSSWSNISDNLPNIPIHSIIKQKVTNDKLWIGTELGVYFIDDNLDDWQAYNSGLPNVIVRELDINYAFNLIYASTYGRGMWKALIPSEIDPVNLTSPSDMSQGIELSPTLMTWEKLQNISDYSLQLSTREDFSSFVINEIVSQSQQEINSLSNYTKYYWRVRAFENGVYGPWSDVWEYTTIVDKPTLLSPNLNEEALPLDSIVDWDDVDGANGYRIQMSTDELFSDVIVDEQVTNSEYNYSGLENYTKYWWRVLSNDPSGKETEWSAIRNFETVISKATLVNPNDNSFEISTNNISFEWEAVPGANQYQLQLSSSQDFSTIIDEFTTSDINETRSLNLENFTDYWWRVRGSKNGNYGAWSDPWSFKTSIDKVNLTFPLNASFKIDTAISLTWESINYATGYLIELSTNDSFDDIIIRDSNQNNSYQYNNFEFNSRYHWRVSAKYQNVQGQFSDIYEFTTELMSSELISPADGSFDLPSNGNLNWSSVEGADNYIIQMDNEGIFEDIIIDETVSSTTQSFENLPKNDRYYWRVKALNINNESDWSDVWSFSTEISKPLLDYPVNNIRNLDTGLIELGWIPLSGVTSYDLQVSNDNQFNSIILDQENIQSNLYAVRIPNFNSLVYWRVRAKINENSKSEWSDVWDFATTLPQPTLISPSNNSIDNEYKTLNLSWDEETLANNYNVQISKNESFDQLFDMSGKYNSNSIQLSDLEANTVYYWRVNSESNIAISNWSDVWEFKTKEGTIVETFDNLSSEIRVYPNPASDFVNLIIDLSSEYKVLIRILNAKGQVIKELSEKDYNSGITNVHLDLNNLPTGVYFLDVRINNTSKSIKLLIGN